MKRILSVAMVLVLAAVVSAVAAPSFYGSKGLLRVISAENEGKMNFGFGLHGTAFMDSSNRYGNGALGINFAINDMFELSLGPAFDYAQVKSGGSWVPGFTSASYGMLDTRFGVKVSKKFSDAFTGGFYAAYDMPFTYGAVGDTMYHRKPVSPASHTGKIHALLIPTYAFGDGRVHLNTGILYDLDKTIDPTNPTASKSVYPNFGIPYGFGFEYKTQYVTPMFELSSVYMMDSTKYGGHFDASGNWVAGDKTRGPLNYDFWLTPGVRVTPISGLGIDLAFSYNLMDTAGLGGIDKEADWYFIAGVSYSKVAPAVPPVPPTGLIAGKITDEKTGKGISATVSAAGISGSTGADGSYSLAGIALGPATLHVEAKGYVPKDIPVTVTKAHKKTALVQDVALALKPIPKGTITGKITDVIAGTPLVATINFAGAKPGTATSDATNGIYKADLEIGSYTATATAEGYVAQSASVTVKEKEPAMQHFALVKKGATMTLNVTFTAKGVVTSAAIEQALSILKANPNLKAEITRTLDKIGSKKRNATLAQTAADNVLGEFVKAGIAGSRLTAKGVLPPKPGKTVKARKANTKVEITFVQ
ncbi:MAG: carboxypeptidase regulatory-like domain-containing protein [Candidatus Edwardsbacteria bacterium]